MMLAAKHFDPVVGVDVHIIQPPGPVPPVPVPHPFVGFLVDPFDYVPIVGATVYVNGIPRAQAGTAGKCVPPHIPIGGVFVKPPANECEMFMGSATVAVDGDAFSYMALPALSCHCIGMPPIPRLKKKSKTKSLVLPTSMVLPIPMGPPVLVGGPPTISLMALGMRVGMAALGKAFRKLGKTKLGKKIKGKFKKGKAKSKAPSHNKGCGRPGEPVDVVSGANVDRFVDFAPSGDGLFCWTRYYDSSASGRDGAFGPGFRHQYERSLRRTAAGFEYLTQEGETVEFIRESPDQSILIHDGLQLRLIGSDQCEVAEFSGETMLFRFPPGGATARLERLARDPDRLDFRYDREGRLASIHDVSGGVVRVESNADGRIVRLLQSRQGDSHERVISRYAYADGMLTAWEDAMGSRATYRYGDGRRMVQKTDRNGYSYYYQYDAEGRCVEARGQDGMYAIRVEYFPESNFTMVTWADGGCWT